MRYFGLYHKPFSLLIKIKSVLVNKQSERINEWNLWMSFGFKYAQWKRTLVTVSSQMIERIIDWTLWMIKQSFVAVKLNNLTHQNEWLIELIEWF